MGQTLRVVLDTNVLLSGIDYPDSLPGKILAAWRHGSPEVLAIQAEVIEPRAEQDAALRDANYQPVLGTLLAAQAEEGASYLITSDKDLLALADRYAIVTPAAFWAVHGGLAG